MTLACSYCGKRDGAPVVATDGAAANLPAPAESASPLPPSPGASASAVPIIALPDASHRFQKMALTPEQLTSLVAAAPELARVGSEVTFFEPGDGTYLTRSHAAHEDFIFTSQPVVWTPKSGVRVLVLAAHGKESSFVAAWSEAEGGGLRLQSAFVLIHELSPIALGYRKTEPDLWWTTCWQCGGETGHVSVRDDGHVVIVQD
jgi:hypothetical protein